MKLRAVRLTIRVRLPESTYVDVPVSARGSEPELVALLQDLLAAGVHVVTEDWIWEGDEP